MFKPQGSVVLTDAEPQIRNNFSNNSQVSNNNVELGNFHDDLISIDNPDTKKSNTNDNTILSDKRICEINSNNIPETTNDYPVNSENLILADNYVHKTFQCPENLINENNLENTKNKVGSIKKSETSYIIEENLNCSTNSLVSDNLSSPMQTSTDVFLDSEIFSTDAASNDSHSPKNIQNIDTENNKKPGFNTQNNLLEVKRFNEFCLSYNKPVLYASNDNFSNPKSDQSLLNSAESCDSSPVHKVNREYKKVPKKYKTKKHFGVKTLQSIFSRRDGYSDISSTASEIGDDVVINKNLYSSKSDSPTHITEIQAESSIECNDIQDSSDTAVYKCTNNSVSETSPQFEENIHNFLSETFSKNFTTEQNVSSITINKSTGNKKYFKLNGQNLRIGKALRLCPNDEYSDQPLSPDNDQKKEKLLARYVYNSNLFSVDGIGDPDFGTPV